MNDTYIPGQQTQTPSDIYIPGMNVAPTETPSDVYIPGMTNSSDPWSNFTQSAKKIAAENNYPVSVLLGQAALESGKGTSNYAKNRNNYFGYMAYDSNPDMAKSYNTPEESIQDYINLIKNNPRYSWAYNQYLQDKDPYKLIAGIKASGYATDPNYVQQVTSLPEFLNNLSN